MLAAILHLKGAAVAHKGKSFLFLGRGGNGKTELVKAMCANGAGLMTNTHLLVDGGSVYGVKSNIRVRDDGQDVYIPVDEELKVHDGWLPIGGVFWVKYRTDGRAVVRTLPSDYARANLQYFSESIRNWELKEDIADYLNSDPFELAEHMNGIDKMLTEFCETHYIRYMNLDIFSDQGMEALISAMEVAH
ncbi:hypothetical protein ACFUEN_44860 [Streptomyces griseorubiginosus]|uniref:hypothetical protein n=1 Tax=Streptomyces griseorubiginosus TaxID=67304 RepID=UPI003633ABDE